MRTICRVSALLLVGMILGGCPTSPKRGDVQREWSLTLREMGVNPVFPPREDLCVGDIYLRRGDPNDLAMLVKKGFVPIDLWVASVDATGEVTGHYSRRPSFADTMDPPPARADPGADGEKAREKSLPPTVVGVPEFAEGKNAFSINDLKKLRQVAFPDFASLTIRGADLRGLVPVEALSVAFGVSWQGQHQVDVRIPMAESYGLPLATISPLLFEGGEGEALRLREEILPGPLRALLLAGQRRESGKAGACDDQVLYIDVITEVFYARSIDISISRKESFGARARVKPVVVPGTPASGEPSAGGEAPPEGEAPPSPPPDGGVDDSAKPETTDVVTGDAFVRAERLNRRLREADAQDQVGGSVQFLSVSDLSVGMRRTYERPIAVGWRGISLRVQVGTGAIVDAAPVSGGQAHTTAGNVDEFLAQLSEAIRSELPSPFDEPGNAEVLIQLARDSRTIRVLVRPDIEITEKDRGRIDGLLFTTGARQRIRSSGHAILRRSTFDPRKRSMLHRVLEEGAFEVMLDED